mmetsp:Transcript_3973/g.5456  ORF Transcript_3973/g.5456 Transcript_3973/m.5456 type:complete len:449 (+) Transcript_3973:53-1399(+)
MAARPTINVFSLENGMVDGQVPLPCIMTAPIRPDIVHFVHYNMSKNSRQPYAVSKRAGHQTSAESWGTGRAVARIPRVGGGGTQRSGQGAFGNMCRGGRMFAPTRIWRRWHRPINLNQRRYAMASAIAASAVPSLVMARGHKVDQVPELPLVVDNSIQSIKKTKYILEALSKVGAKDDCDKASKSRHVRAGKGKSRNRRYVMRRGPLVIYAQDDGITKSLRNLPGVETSKVTRLNLLKLAPGGHLGRFVVWTKSAIKSLDKIYGTYERKGKKVGYTLPRPLMTNADIHRIMESEELKAFKKVAQRPIPRTINKSASLIKKISPYCARLKNKKSCPKKVKKIPKKEALKKTADTKDDKLEVKEAIPVTKETTPATKEAIPATKVTIPASKEKAPETKEKAPATKEAAPATKSAFPAIKEKAPASKGKGPAAKETAPATKGKAPATKGKK